MKGIPRLLRVLVGALLLPQAAAVAQDVATITGRVINTEGAPIAGASAFLQGMGLGAITRDDGTYSISVAGARARGQVATLTVRLVGYRPQSAQVTLRPGTTTQNFTMATAPQQLGAVVVTGAGTVTTAEKLGNVRSSVDSSLIRRSNESNIVQALAGKVPGVQINQQSGEPGASSYIRIRGAKTLTGTGQPLIVVDGSPIDNSTVSTGASTASTVSPNRASDINPNDVESVEILKGAAAAAIYGARAGQGVVLITTKSGRSGQTRYSLRTNISIDDVNRTPPLQTSFGQGTAGVAATCAAVNCRPSPLSWGPRLASGTRIYDQATQVFDRGSLFENTLTASGGNDRTTFYLSGSQSNQQGIIRGPNNLYNKSTVRLKATHRLLSNLTVGGNVSYVDARQKAVQKGSNVSGLLLGAWRTPPEFDNRYYIDSTTKLHRSYRFPRPSATATNVGRGYDNPFFLLNVPQNTANVGRAYGNVTAEYAPFAWLTLKETFGSDYSNDERLEALPLATSTAPNGQVLRANFVNRSFDHNLTATATRQFSQNLAATFTLGQNLNSRQFVQSYIQGDNLIAAEPFVLNNTTDLTAFPFESLRRIEAYFGQASFDLFDQLFITTSLRNDGFSTFGRNKQRAWFPRGSVAWTFTNFTGTFNDILSLGKLRMAIGQTGTEPQVYSTNAGFSTSPYGLGWGGFLSKSPGGQGGLSTGQRREQLNLGPERNTEFETGTDLSFYADRANFGFTFYNAKSTAVIYDVPLPATTGFTTQAQNAGTIRNRGYEVTLDLTPIRQRDLRWDVGMFWSQNNNKVLDLKGADFVDVAAGTFFGASGAAVKGSRVGVLRGDDFARCRYQETSNVVDGIDINAVCKTANAPNGALYIGADGFPIYDGTQRVIADPNPSWTGGVRSSVTFQKFTFSGLLDIKQGGQVWNGTKGALTHFGTHKDTDIRGQTRTFGKDWPLGGAGSATYPVVGPGAGRAVVLDQDWFSNGLGSGFNGPSSQFMEDGSFVKLRELAVAYTLTFPTLRNALGLSSIDLRVAGRNLGLWTKYTGIDPETNLAGAEALVQGIDYFNNPQTRSMVFTIGLNR